MTARRKPRTIAADAAAILSEAARTREALREQVSLTSNLRNMVDARKDTIRQMEREQVELVAQLEQARREIADLRANPLVAPRQRERMPAMRDGVCWKLRVGATDKLIECHLHVNCFEDGRVGEIWLKFAIGQHFVAASLADAMCIMASLALQYGVSLSVILDKLVAASDESGGMTRRRIDHADGTETWEPDHDVPMCQSLRDFIGKKIRANTDENGRLLLSRRDGCGSTTKDHETEGPQ